jgi:hypothetical protein
MLVCVYVSVYFPREPYDAVPEHRLASDGVWHDVGCAEYEDKYVNHVDETISLLAWARIEEMKLTQQLTDIGRLLRAGEWVTHESEVLGLPERCKQLTEENSQLRKQLTEESIQLREQAAEQARELQSIKDLLATKEKRGWFGK